MPQGTRILSAATPGLSRLAQALATGDGAYQQGYDQQLGLQSKLAQMMAAARASDAQAQEHMARAGVESTKGAMLQNRPALVDELTANAAGTDVPMVQAIRSFVQTGQRPQVPMGPETEDGQMGVGSHQFDPAMQTRVSRELQRLAPVLMSGGDVKVDDWAKANEAYRNMDLGDQVLNGQRTAGEVGKSQAAIAAKPMFNSDANGSVLDLFGGALDTSNPMAQGTIALKKEQAGAQKANAAQSYASAENSRASAARTRAEMEQGVKTGALQIVTGDDGSINIVNKATGIARRATDEEGKALMGKSKELTDAQAKANLFGTRMAEADRILGSLEGKYSPSKVNAKVSAGDLPIVGGVAGFAGNAMLSEADQQAEQAQRDFINAVLRRESGAVIAPSEFANAAKQYFPQPNDKPGTLAQKARNRKLAIEGLMAEVPENRRPQPSAPAQPSAPQRNVVVNW